MRAGNRHTRCAALVDLFACFLIPAYTLLFAGGKRWFSTNFSVLAVTGQDHYRGFFFWGLLAGGYFLAVLLDLSRTLSRRCERLILRLLALSAVLCLCAALAVPYLPVLAPRWADLHVVLAFSACVLLMIALFFTLMCCRPCPGLFRFYWCIVLGSGLLFCLCGIVSSALEVFFTVSTALFARRLWRHLRKT